VTRLPVHLRLLNGFDLRVRGKSVNVQVGAQRLACFLALQSCPVRRSYVAGTLWPDTPEARSGANLRTTLWRLSRGGLHLVEATVSTLRLTDDVTVDLRTCVARARHLVESPDDFIDSDVELMAGSGDLLPDCYEDWVVIERERFRLLRLHALEALCHQLVSCGRYALAVEAGHAAVDAEPLRESARRAVVSAHVAEGNRRDAIRQYLDYRRLLWKELRIRPSPAFERFIDELSPTDGDDWVTLSGESERDQGESGRPAAGWRAKTTQPGSPAG
jgi:DNA-binding SARP family transcriptional activator